MSGDLLRSVGEAYTVQNNSSVIKDYLPIPEVCRRIIEEMPPNLLGVDRLRYLAENVNSLLQKDRDILRDHMHVMLRQMIRLGASDMEFGGPGSNGWIWYRINGDKMPRTSLGTYKLDEASLLILSLLTERQMEHLIQHCSLDFSYMLDAHLESPQRFRASAYLDMDHLALSVRAINPKVFPLKSLGFHPLIERGLMFRHVRDGLTLVTGVTGSGKSTTLDAIIDANNNDVNAHVIIIAQPIEYVHRSRKCIIRHREVGRDVHSFKEGIVQALRQDPDIVVIGEMRDPETISAALEITDSGHRVFSTLHTSSAVETIDRIIAEYPPNEQERVRNRLADVLRCVISQKLLPRVGGGRILAKEVLWVTPSVRAAIKNGNTGEIYQMIWEGGKLGMTTLEQDLAQLVRRGLITRETATDYANNKKRLNMLLA